MPWLIRLIGSLVIYRFISRRFQAARDGAAGRSMQMPKVNVPIRDILDDAAIGTHLVAASVAGFLALVAGVVASTLLILGPRWLGGIVAVLAVIAVGVAWWQGSRFSRQLQTRNWRHREIVVTSDEETLDAG